MKNEEEAIGIYIQEYADGYIPGWRIFPNRRVEEVFVWGYGKGRCSSYDYQAATPVQKKILDWHKEAPGMKTQCWDLKSHYLILEFPSHLTVYRGRGTLTFSDGVTHIACNKVEGFRVFTKLRKFSFVESPLGEIWEGDGPDPTAKLFGKGGSETMCLRCEAIKPLDWHDMKNLSLSHGMKFFKRLSVRKGIRPPYYIRPSNLYCPGGRPEMAVVIEGYFHPVRVKGDRLTFIR